MRVRALLSTLLLGASSTALFAGCPATPPASRVPEPPGPTLVGFTLREHVGHRSEDELIHFDFDVASGTASLSLYDDAGSPVPAQIEVRAQKGGRVSGSVWTVVSLAPYEEKRFELREGSAVPPGVSVREEAGDVVIANDRMAVRLPRWPGASALEMKLSSLPAPLGGVRRATGEWACDARWVNEGAALRVRGAATRVIESGPVRARVAQRMTLADGRFYEAVVTLAARQDAAIVVEDSDIDEPESGYRVSMQRGLSADQVFWQAQYQTGGKEKPWELLDQPVSLDADHKLFRMRAWSFWAYPRIAEWAGFYRKGADPFVGVMMLRPSRWSPHGWDGFDFTEIPVTAGPRNGIEARFPLTAMKGRPLHREWAITADLASEHVTTVPARAKLRRELIKYSEFPLDEVKDYGFDFTPPPGGTPHLFVGPDDLARARRQAAAHPAVKARVDKAIGYLDQCQRLEETLKQDGPEALYKRYVHHGLVEALPEAYLGSADPKYGAMMAAVVKGLAGEVMKVFVDEPSRPAIGAYGPWFSETVTQLLAAHDLIAGTGLLTPEEEARVRHLTVFAAHVMAHPDYWYPEHGMAMANPNMSSSILLPRGLLGLALRGHPEADGWLSGAEAELKRELEEWVSPGGAWIENPYYQTASLDGMMLLAEALRRGTGRDYFKEQRFEETLDYFGFLLTPPDRRFPPERPPETRRRAWCPASATRSPGG